MGYGATRFLGKMNIPTYVTVKLQSPASSPNLTRTGRNQKGLSLSGANKLPDVEKSNTPANVDLSALYFISEFLRGKPIPRVAYIRSSFLI
jgi:hypothetical protein